jgi:hypothetical protein
MQKGPELIAMKKKLLILVKINAGTRNQLDLLLNA